MEIIKNKQRYELVIRKDASRKEYEVVLNYLIDKLQLKKGEVEETDDFDSFFHLFIMGTRFAYIIATFLV